jgi:hypothetical protein
LIFHEGSNSWLRDSVAASKAMVKEKRIISKGPNYGDLAPIPAFLFVYDKSSCFYRNKASLTMLHRKTQELKAVQKN